MFGATISATVVPCRGHSVYVLITSRMVETLFDISSKLPIRHSSGHLHMAEHSASMEAIFVQRIALGVLLVKQQFLAAADTFSPIFAQALR